MERPARALGLDAGAPAGNIAAAAEDPERWEAVREWGEALADLLAADPQGLAGVVARAGALRAALDPYRETGDRPREGRAWHNYRVALNARGRTPEAVTACLNSLYICREFEDWHGSARTLYALALVHDSAGDASGPAPT
ncbi:tetratricopeptide repeat protein [Streptomyces sp. NPDC058534]|uniref:tetratricopeptide repeat protein n=1 Tax=Streptomyces sp. NPDC058534 TaxID=3346541 RepID=UPI0036509B49